MRSGDLVERRGDGNEAAARLRPEERARPAHAARMRERLGEAVREQALAERRVGDHEAVHRRRVRDEVARGAAQGEFAKVERSDRLAAVHFKNRYIQQSHCYVCHTDYGLFGTLEAKLAGVTHIWRESTGSFTLPVRISRPYRFTICLDCHGQSAKFNSVAKHEGLVPRIAAGEAVCTSCHGLSHQAPEKRGV